MFVSYPLPRVVFISYPVSDPYLFSHRNPTKKDYEEAARLGIRIRKGPYSDEECEVIRDVFRQWTLIEMDAQGVEVNESNYKEYLIRLLGFFRRGQGRQVEGRGKKTIQLMVTIGKRLRDRTIMSLYSKCRDLMNPLLTLCELSSDQQREVIEYMVNNPSLTPAQIALRFNIAPRTVNILKDNSITKTRTIRHSGPWSPQEDAMLIKSVLRVIESDKIEDALWKDIPWATVATEMKTRTLKQCYERFTKSLQWKIGVVDLIQDGDVSMRLMDMAKILYFIHMSIQYKHVKARYDDIDWNALVDALPHLDMRTIMALFDKLMDQIPKEFKTAHITFKKQVRWLFEHKIKELISPSGDSHAELETFWIENCIGNVDVVP